MDLKQKLRHVQNFPKKGIDFIDITTVLQDGDALKYAIDSMVDIAKNYNFDVIVAPESRGFVLGTPISYIMGKGFIPIRKKGKLPYKTVGVEYKKEYGSDYMEMHVDSIKPGDKVLIVDDLLATGGTSRCNIDLVEQLGGKVVGLLYLVELEYLNGRNLLDDYDIKSILKYDK